MVKLEICCYGLDCAITAEQGGADRIELCTAPKEGGLTPSKGMLERVRSVINIPVHPIIRPRGGDFCYTTQEIDVIKADVVAIRDLGFPGIVIGILDEDGNIDVAKMREVLVLSEGMSVTFHRAFDLCQEPISALKILEDLGVDRILTSGQQQNAEKGIKLIKELTELSQGPSIMAGAGVRLSNIQKFLDAGIREIHSSAGSLIPSPMRYRKLGVSMSSGVEADEYSRYIVDLDTVKKMKHILSCEQI